MASTSGSKPAPTAQALFDNAVVAKQQHTALSYKKWDNIDDSDSDEEEKNRKARGPINPVLENTKSSQRREDDENIAKHFRKRMDEYCGKHRSTAAIPEGDREMVARFIGACDPGKEPQKNAKFKTNTHRYNDILKFATRYGPELLTAERADQMCELHCAMQNAAKDLKDENDPLQMDNRILMMAINSLEACRVNPNATAFYEMVCTPSMSDRAAKLCKTYYDFEFGKRALMRHIFHEQYDKGYFKDEERKFKDLLSESEVSADGKSGIVPPGSSRQPDPEPTGWAAMSHEDVFILSLTGGVLALLIAIGLGAYFYLLPLSREYADKHDAPADGA